MLELRFPQLKDRSNWILLPVLISLLPRWFLYLLRHANYTFSSFWLTIANLIVIRPQWKSEGDTSLMSLPILKCWNVGHAFNNRDRQRYESLLGHSRYESFYKIIVTIVIASDCRVLEKQQNTQLLGSWQIVCVNTAGDLGMKSFTIVADQHCRKSFKTCRYDTQTTREEKCWQEK